MVPVATPLSLLFPAVLIPRAFSDRTHCKSMAARERLPDNDSRLEEPREISTAGNHRLKGIATGTISTCIIDQAGVRQQVRLLVVVVPRIGYIFSVPSVTEQGATTIFALQRSRVETNGFTIPLQ